MGSELVIQQADEEVDQQVSTGHEIKVVKQWFFNEKIELDGWHFVGCRFDNCILIIKTPNFALERCMVDKSTKFRITKASVTTVQAYNHQLRILPGFEYFWPEFHDDGTVSIGVK